MSGANTEDMMKRKSTSRSVTDFQSADDLRGALRSMNQDSSVVSPSLNSSAVDTVHKVVDSSKKVAAPDTIDAVGTELGISQKIPLIQPSQSARARNRNNSQVIDPNEDEETVAKRAMETELRRLAVLKSYRVIGSGKNAAYERLVSLASRIYKAPIAYVSVLDLAKQHLLAARGLGAMASSEHERDMSICTHLIDTDHDILVVPDLSQDEQFKEHQNVKGVPHLRFYAGSPLICPEGYRLGTLCVLDTEPRPEGLSFHMKQNLREIADMVMDVMVEERERKIFEYRQPSQMIACTSNDLMTPLLGVVQGLSTIRDDQKMLDSLSVQQKEVFNTAFACSSVMTRICKKSLESFSKKQKIQSFASTMGDDVDEKEKNLLNISDLVRHLHVVMDPFPKRVPLVVTTFDEVPNVIVADDLKIFRSIVNFLTNACANTDTGSVHLKIFLKDDREDGDVSDNDDAEQQSIVFMVEDTGNGISVDKYQYLFKPVVSETDEKDTSCTLASFGDSNAKSIKTGLGLYSVATQIGSIGGKYGFRPRGFSESGSQLYDENGNVLRGSIFWFSIKLVVPDSLKDVGASVSAPPVSVEDSDEEDVDTTHDKRKWNADDEAALDENFSNFVSVGGEKRSFKAFVGEPSGARQKRALLIDDSLVTRRNTSRALEKMGFEVVEAVNGMEGLNELQANLYDLVLCDFLMPVMDGTDCVQQYRQFEVASRPWFDQYIVGMSAHANEGDVERALKVGMNDYCEKPVTMKQLEEIIQGQEYKFVTTRLDSIAADMRDNNDEAAKHPKTDTDMSDAASSQSEQALKVCLIVEDGDSLSSVAEHVAEKNGWKSVVVHNGESALRLLQMRNWDAVLIDDGLQGLTSCMVMEHFREWESKNRVNRQKNVFQVNSSFIPSHLAMSSMVQLPSGFDGALGKPVSAKGFKEFLQRSMDGKNCMSHDIVRR